LALISKHASEKALFYLKRLGINVLLNTRVTDYDGELLSFADGHQMKSRLVIWAAGISGEVPSGIPNESVGRGKRMLVDEYSKLKGFEDIYSIGDASIMSTSDYPNGHPQVAQVAIQQGTNLAKNYIAIYKNAKLKPFRYIDRGSMATIGRNRAVADLSFLKFSGFVAWLTWMFVHLMAILGVKNRLLIFVNWMWNYITYDQSLRLILRVADSKKEIQPIPEEKMV
jgi:NADH dehydrogenase